MAITIDGWIRAERAGRKSLTLADQHEAAAYKVLNDWVRAWRRTHEGTRLAALESLCSELSVRTGKGIWGDVERMPLMEAAKVLIGESDKSDKSENSETPKLRNTPGLEEFYGLFRAAVDAGNKFNKQGTAKVLAEKHNTTADALVQGLNVYLRALAESDKSDKR